MFLIECDTSACQNVSKSKFLLYVIYLEACGVLILREISSLSSILLLSIATSDPYFSESKRKLSNRKIIIY